MAAGNPLGPVAAYGVVTGAERAQKLLGHEFARPDLLAEALTHRSAAGTKGLGSNERLEFIGDRVLGLIVAEWLIERFPAEQEGELGRRLAALVSGQSLAVAAEALGLAPLLSVSPGETKRGVRDLANVLADALEALIGAVFLDGGLAPARDFVRRALGRAVDAQGAPPKDPKNALQELAAARGLPPPIYQVVEQSGPPHAPQFVVGVAVAAQAERGEAGSKRAAEQAAARALLARMA